MENITRQQYQDEVKEFWSKKCKKLQTENKLIKGLIKMALDELGVPNKDYPAPVANAVDILKEVLKG